MRTALTVLITILACCINCYTQTNEKRGDGLCADNACLDQKFSYMFCDGEGNVVYKCSANPNNESGLKLIKVKVPVEVEYQSSTLNPIVTGGDGVIKFYEGTDTNFFGYPVFVNDRMPGIISEAARRWSIICPQQGPDDEYPECKLTIRWSYDDSEYAGNNILTSGAFMHREVSGNNCEIDCPLSAIVLNQQDRYLRPDAYGRPRYFIGTERENYGYLFAQPGYYYLDAYTVIVHELGHWLGFGHSDGNNRGNSEACGDPSGIMKSEFASAEVGDLGLPDVCMFLKAYCCEKTQKIVYVPTDPCPECPPEDHTKSNTGGTDTSSDFGFTAMPNPATAGTVNVTIYGTITTGNASIRVADASGNIVLIQQLHNASNTHEISVDVSSLSTGVYMLQLVEGDRTFGRKIIIAE